MPTQNHNPQAPGAGADSREGQHNVASPNPTVDDSKPRGVEGAPTRGESLRPAQSTTAAPMKSKHGAKRKTKPRRRT